MDLRSGCKNGFEDDAGEDHEEVDKEELAMMGGCYEAPLNAMVRGGKLSWQGDGIWVPESV